MTFYTFNKFHHDNVSPDMKHSNLDVKYSLFKRNTVSKTIKDKQKTPVKEKKPEVDKPIVMSWWGPQFLPGSLDPVSSVRPKRVLKFSIWCTVHCLPTFHFQHSPVWRNIYQPIICGISISYILLKSDSAIEIFIMVRYPKIRWRPNETKPHLTWSACALVCFKSQVCLQVFRL